MDKELRARCSQKHLTALQALAKLEDIPAGEMLRLLVRDRAKELGVWPDERCQAILTTLGDGRYDLES